MFTNKYTVNSVNQDRQDVRASSPLLQMAQIMRLEKGAEALMDIEQPAFARRLLFLGLPQRLPLQKTMTVPQPISRLLNIVLGQDGILFPLEEN